jgi:hypothetical protein
MCLVFVPGTVALTYPADLWSPVELLYCGFAGCEKTEKRKKVCWSAHAVTFFSNKFLVPRPSCCGSWDRSGSGVAPLIGRPTSSYGLISTSPKLLGPICPQHFLLLTNFTMKNVLKLGKSTATSLDFQCVRTSALKQEYSTSNALSSDTLNPASSQQRCGCHATIHATLSLSLYTTQSRLSPVGGLFSYYSNKQVGS